MNKSDIIKTIKEMFSSVEETVEEKFLDVKTSEGLILRVDDLSPGSKVMEINEDGLVEIQDGEHMLEDGITLIIKDGIIEEVKEVESLEDKAEEEAIKEEFEAEEIEEFESFNDYPQQAVDNAKKGIELNEAVDNECATAVGKQRAQDIANRRGLSFKTIKRTYAYLSRAEEYYNPEDETACGTISFLLWGGKSMKSYCENKINEMEKEEKFEEIEEVVEETTEKFEETTLEETTLEEIKETIEEKFEEEVEEIEEEVEEIEEVKYASVEEVEKLKEEFTVMIDELKEQFETIIRKKDEEFKQLNQEFSKFKKEPSVEKLETKYDYSAMTKEDKLKFLKR